MKLEDIKVGDLCLWANGPYRVEVEKGDRERLSRSWVIEDCTLFTPLSNDRVDAGGTLFHGGLRVDYYHKIKIITPDGRCGTIVLFDFQDYGPNKTGREFKCKVLGPTI